MTQRRAAIGLTPGSGALARLDRFLEQTGPAATAFPEGLGAELLAPASAHAARGVPLTARDGTLAVVRVDRP
ncbi:MAG TPA: hypothetical protein PLB02_13430, partial [Thermoanaerobaculia bacterium]|nr:hypothetical protein [Thermoanaerobaculia bacterium]